MDSNLSSQVILLRLACTCFAGLLFGINRTERGRTAGLRTTLLASLAAAVSMIQANLFLSTCGKATDSFAHIDPMRMPLGILTGMGFIGAGTILRQGHLIQGVTTAATLWIETVIGFCFGAGHLFLGGLTTVLGMAVLWGLAPLENRLARDRSGTLLVKVSGPTQTADSILPLLRTAGYQIDGCDVTVKQDGELSAHSLRYRLHWRSGPNDSANPVFLERLARMAGVRKVKWSV
jgi:putative Mg2+ transporter-C (MgtC) family protein